MDLKELRKVKKHFDELDREDKVIVAGKAGNLRKYLESQLPALCESDLAAVAYIMADLMSTLHHSSVADIGDLLHSSNIAYSVAAVDLMGWLDQKPPAKPGLDVPDSPAGA